MLSILSPKIHRNHILNIICVNPPCINMDENIFTIEGLAGVRAYVLINSSNSLLGIIKY